MLSDITVDAEPRLCDGIHRVFERERKGHDEDLAHLRVPADRYQLHQHQQVMEKLVAQVDKELATSVTMTCAASKRNSQASCATRMSGLSVAHKQSESNCSAKYEESNKEEVAQRLQLMREKYDYLQTVRAKSPTRLFGANWSVHTSSLPKRRRLFDASRLGSMALRVTESTAFHACVSILICLNTVLVGVITDHDLRSAILVHRGGTSEDTPAAFFFLELFIVVAFFVELFFRVAARGWGFFFGKYWKGNLFDTLVTFSALFDLTVAGVNLSFGRMLRLFKLFSTMRTFRHMNIGIKLRTMVIAITSSLPSLLWASVLLGLTTFVFACIVVQGAAMYVDGALVGDQNVAYLESNLNSVPLAFVTLWACVSGGISWLELERVLRRMHFSLGLILVVYVCVMLLALLNIVTGIFVNDSIETAQMDRKIQTRRHDVQDSKHMEMLEEIFRELDENGSGSLDKDEFKQYLLNPRVRNSSQGWVSSRVMP